MQEIRTDAAPTFAEFPFSQAIEHDGVVYLSGNVPVTPDGDLVTGDIQAQTTQVMDNIGAILEAAGSSFGHVIKATVFLTDAEKFGAFNEVYASYFEDPYPARSAVVTDLVIDVDVEVEVIAAVE